MSNFRTLDRTILAKVESTPGTDASPVVATDAVLVENPQTSAGLAVLDTNEVTGALDARASVVGGGGASMSFTALMRGSGAAGTAPEWGTLVKGCGFAETILGADVNGTAQAGTASTIQLAASGPSATNDIYNHMVIEIVSGTGAGQFRVITDYVGATKTCTIYPNWTVNPDATSVYSIDDNALYSPASSSLANLSLYDYQHKNSGNSLLTKVLGAMGTFSLTWPVRELPRAAFQFSGKFSTPTDVSDPGAATYDAQRPTAVQGELIYLNGVAVKVNTLSIDIGNTVTAADDPADTYGIDVAGIVRRRTTGRINPPRENISTRNVFAAFLAGTQWKYWHFHNGGAGNRVSIYIPQLTALGSEADDNNGFAHEGIPFHAAGEDSAVYISVA